MTTPADIFPDRTALVPDARAMVSNAFVALAAEPAGAMRLRLSNPGAAKELRRRMMAAKTHRQRGAKFGFDPSRIIVESLGHHIFLIDLDNASGLRAYSVFELMEADFATTGEVNLRRSLEG